MSVFAQVWFWALLAFLVGALLTWVLLVRPDQRRSQPSQRRESQRRESQRQESQRQVSPPAERRPTGGDARNEPAENAQGAAVWPGEPGGVPVEEADAGRPRTRWLEQDSLRGMSTQVGGFQQQHPTAPDYPRAYEQRRDYAPDYPPPGSHAQDDVHRAEYGHTTAGQGYVAPYAQQQYAPPDYVEEQRPDSDHPGERYAEDQYVENQYADTDYVEGEGVEEYRTAGESGATAAEGYTDPRTDQTVGGADLFGAEDSGQFGYSAPQQPPLFEQAQEAQDQVEYPAGPQHQAEAEPPSTPVGYEPPAEQQTPATEPGTPTSLPKRQRGATNRIRGGFEPPRPIQPSVRPVLRRTPQDPAQVSSGSLFEPADTPPGDQGGHHQAPPARSHAEDSSEPPGPFGPGSAMPLPGGGRPGPGFTVKASVTALRYCSEDSPQFPRMVAEVWFATPADAERVGFRPLT